MAKYTQRSDGRWATRIWDGTTTKGRKNYVYLYSSKSSKDLERKVIEMEAKRLTGGVVIKTDGDIYSYALKWLYSSKSLREKATQYMYNNVITVHLKSLQNASWDYFNVSTIQGIINDKAEHPRTCQQIRVTLVQIGRAAEYDKLISKGTTDEIFRHVVIPKYRPKEKSVLTQSDKDALLKADFSPKERAFVFTLYFTGLRREEALALTKGDIGDAIRVDKALGFDANNPYIKPVKSERGNRLVPVPEMLREILADYTKDMTTNDNIFRPGGLTTKSSYRKLWESIQRKIGAAGGNPKLTAHVFRHNYCTMLCYTAVTDHTITTKKIAALLGDTEKMVIDVYSHILEEQEKTEQSIDNALKFG